MLPKGGVLSKHTAILFLSSQPKNHLTRKRCFVNKDLNHTPDYFKI